MNQNWSHVQSVKVNFNICCSNSENIQCWLHHSRWTLKPCAYDFANSSFKQSFSCHYNARLENFRMSTKVTLNVKPAAVSCHSLQIFSMRSCQYIVGLRLHFKRPYPKIVKFSIFGYEATLVISRYVPHIL